MSITLKQVNQGFILLTGIVLASCAGSKHQALLDAVDSPQTRPSTFEALREDFEAADNEEVPLVAPEDYIKAKRLYEDALQMQAEGKPGEKYNPKLTQSRKYLDAAITFSRENKDALAPLMNARKTALNSNTATLNNKTFKDLEEKYVDLVSDLQNKRDRPAALDRVSRLTIEYQELTTKSLQSKYLGEAEANMDLAITEGAKDIAPKTFRETEALILKAKNFIAQDQNESSSMASELGNSALIASRRLLVITRQAKAIKGLSPEDISLKTESLLNLAGATIDGRDLRELSFEAHATALNQSLSGLMQERASNSEGSNLLKSNLEKSQSQIAELKEKTKDYGQLEQSVEKNKRFESVRELFDEDEAEVYRQGDSVIISLKAIKFPVNKSEIPSPSFPLLKKVQTSIRTFKEPSVVVEGHTDSTGSAALNKALSEERAEAVRSYLLSNSVVTGDQITSVGFGSEKPLASNKSVAGRETNRRIDIVIKE